MKILVLLLVSLIVVNAISISDVKKGLLKDLLLRELQDEIQAPENAENAPANSESSSSSSSSSESASEGSIRDQILHMEDLYMEYFKTQNYEALSNLYAEDAYYYAPGVEPVQGKQAIQENVWVPGRGEGEENKEILTFESHHIIDAGKDYQIGHGSWDVKENPDVVGSNNVIADGQYLTVYKKVDGKWLIEVDIINIINAYGGEAPEKDADKEGSDNEVSPKRRLVMALKRMLGEQKRGPYIPHRLGSMATAKKTSR